MDLDSFTARNAAALETLRQGTGTPSYFGYYQVDLFECPPFLMFTNNDCPRAHNILIQKSFEPQSMRTWCRLARTATGILDIGAHVGVYSLAAAAVRPDLNIYAFEPNPHAYTRLRMHRAVNGFDNIVENFYAVGNINKPVHFNWYNKRMISSGGTTKVLEGDSVENIVVHMITLDGTEFASRLGDRGLVKIDAEGGEVAALEGMKDIIARRPDIILETFEKKLCTAVNEIKAKYDYRAFLIHEDEGRLEGREKVTPLDSKGANFNYLLTTRDDDDVLDCCLIRDLTKRGSE